MAQPIVTVPISLPISSIIMLEPGEKRAKPKFDPTIYGHVLTAISIVISSAGTGACYSMSSELHNVDRRVAKIESTLQQLASVMVVAARQDERLISIERRIDRLEEDPRRQP